MISLKRLRIPDLPQRPVYLIVAFGFLILVVLISMALLQRTRAERDRLVATVETDGSLYELVLALRRVESNQRGYLLTGEEGFFKNYEEALPAVENTFRAIENGLGENPAQIRRLETLKPMIDSKLKEMAETVRMYKTGQSADAMGLVRSDLGVRYMNNIRDVIVQMRTENSRQRDRQYADATGQEAWLFGANIVAVTLILVIAAGSVFIVQRANLAMQKAQRVLRDANVQLEASVAARTADLTAANAEIQSFAYIVSHDLRSPLVNIMGFTSEIETLKHAVFEKRRGPALANGAAPAEMAPRPAEPASDEALEQDFDEALGFIKASITKMDRLINSILTISREGTRTLQAESVDLDEMFKSILKAAAHQVQEAEATVTVARLPTIVSDRLALEQVFSNLVDNALKYLRDDEKGRIDVTCMKRDDRVMIEVQDNGRGIAERDRNRVFELFRRAGRLDRPGEGMGLAHTRALVRRLGGTITLDSALGKGSTFRVTLPRTLPDQRIRITS